MSSSPRTTLLLFTSLFLFLAFLVPRALADCSLQGKIYPSAPLKPVIYNGKTCYCDGKEWVRCRSRPVPIIKPSTSYFFTAQQKLDMFKPEDFVFDLTAQTPVDNGEGGDIQTVTAAQLPSLANQGLTYTLITLDPCGINLPHHHPRASEIIFVVKGTHIRTGFAGENGGETVINDLYTGQVTFVPEGLIHFQQNLSCEKSVHLAALNSEDPGVITTTLQLFEFPDDALAGTFGISESKIYELRHNLPASPAAAREQCLKKCQWH